MLETRMNTASPCHSGLLCVSPSQFTLGNGMEEVIGSIPIRSTNLSKIRSQKQASTVVRRNRGV